jgi:hypothetical protein
MKIHIITRGTINNANGNCTYDCTEEEYSRLTDAWAEWLEDQSDPKPRKWHKLMYFDASGDLTLNASVPLHIVMEISRDQS